MSITLLSGDCRDVLPTLAANSVHTCVTSPPYYALRSYLDATHPDKHREIGLEASPDEYLATMVAVFREVKRALRPDGTLWLNIGDSYSSGGRTTQCDPSGNTGTATLADGGARRAPAGIAKPKDLLMMPARLALALQQDGWWIRSDIIWAKPNPMPESVTDRPTSAYEHVFLLTKSARYFYDAEAVREPHSRDWWNEVPSRPGNPDRNDGGGRQGNNETNGRNLRNVWTIATHAYPQAHFATYPPELAERCIRAGTSERGCCSACGAPWRRAVDKAFIPQPDVSLARGVRLETQHDTANQWPGTPRGTTSAITTGWAASCACAADVVPATVLDPFSGASTTLLVAQRLQRQAIGIELNPEYVTMGRQRIEDEAGLFADVQTLGGVPLDVEPEIESPDCSDRRSEGSDLGDAQPSLWEWDRELVPT
jgi:DNA modification methylase